MGCGKWVKRAIAAYVLLTIAACSSSGSSSLNRPHLKILMLTGPASRELEDASRSLRTTRVLVVGDRFRPLYDTSWPGAKRVAAFQSYRVFRRSVDSLPSDVAWVMYDPEPWRFTSVDEQRQPGRAMRLFGHLAHTRGLKVIMAPAPSLVMVAGASCRRTGDEGMAEAFLRCNMAAKAARAGDMVDLQLQVLERDPSAYEHFVSAAARQARAANPRITVLSQLSTSPSTYEASPATLATASRAVEGLVTGHYLSVGPSEVDVARAFLRPGGD
jgi:hypothetical protein